jgi:acyl transferase domain-containing protein
MHNENSDSIAIIGMACRFPGAKNIEEFWQNLCEGKEAITFFSKEEFKSSHPDDVLASPILENVDHFDAEFFEYSPKEARMMDPQHRLLLEVAWHAFEDAGYNPENYSDPIGSFTGSGGVVSSYLLDRMQHINDILGPTGSLEHLGNDKDFLSTRLAYKLNLTGPSLNVQTACSTSLVALHLACQSLLANECKMALVGASTIRFPHRTGYKYSKGDILSPDGHCRPFDAEAQGTLFGSGVAAIIIKPLKAAIADKDHIYAVIKSTAINNDGAHKMSYTASSVDGQAKAMKQAFSKAKISPDQIGYVECHGTGTIVGDPLEINALNRAFNPREKPSQYCPIGSVKGNIGHLEQTAGLAALIKTALILKNGLIPPSINYKNPNPKIPFAKTPFYVNTQLQQWSEQNPRIAGVNSLGLGGTNAFAILQEAPHLNEAHFPTSLAMLNLSAKTSAALSELKNFYLHYLNQNQDLNLQKICYTASVGRLHSTYRDSYLVNTVDDLKAKLSNDLQNPMMKNDGSPAVVFLFTGQGSQYINMAREIYLSQPVFHDALNLCDKLLRPYLDIPLLSLLYDKNNQHLLNETRYTPPVLFSLEYSLAMLWQSWGIQPAAVMGHSVGEYVAACIAGVFSLEDGLFLISERAKLMLLL